MKVFTPSQFLAITIIATQVSGPVSLWAAEQRGIRVEATRQIIVSALKGDPLTVQHVSGPTPLQFRDVVPEDARVTTGDGTTAELLLSNRAVLMLDASTTVQVRMGSTDQTTIQVTAGSVRLSTAASALGSQGLVTVQTPTAQVQTRGGILRVVVDRPAGKAEYPQNGAQAFRASYAPGLLMAAAPQSDLIQVEEGTADLPGLGPTGGLLTVKAGQRVTIQAGRVGSLTEAGRVGAGMTGIPATTGHALTPKEGRNYLVALQVDQAAKLGQALTGAVETSQGESEKKNDTKNVINGATGGGVGAGSNSALVSALFGTGSVANPAGSTPLNTTGTGYGGNNNNGFEIAAASDLKIKGNNTGSLLIFSRKDPVAPYLDNQLCEIDCLFDLQQLNALGRLTFKPMPANVSQFSVTKELVLVGGTPNVGHGGIPPTEPLIGRGVGGTNLSIEPTDRNPAELLTFKPTPSEIVRANSTFVVGKGNESESVDLGGEKTGIVGGTLGQYSNSPVVVDGNKGIVIIKSPDNSHESFIDGAITATGSNVVLKGGVTLDQGTIATIGQTAATKSYFAALGATYTGSLMSVIHGPTGLTKLTMQERMLGVYDGSKVEQDVTDGQGKALLSVLDAKLKGPGSSIPLIDIAAGAHFDRAGKAMPGTPPSVTVTSAIVMRSTTQLDGALLEASAPLVALTQGTPTPTKPIMTTTSHFADMAGKATQSLNLNGALVALSAANLVVNGNLLNLNNATAAISGYLFSLRNGSTLNIINNGSLFSLNNGSALTLNSNAFGVFGDEASKLTITNNLCSTGPCGDLVNTAGHDIKLNGATLRVAGVGQDVVLPNNFNVFAGNDAAKVTIGKDAALFKVDTTSTLTINGARVR